MRAAILQRAKMILDDQIDAYFERVQRAALQEPYIIVGGRQPHPGDAVGSAQIEVSVADEQEARALGAVIALLNFADKNLQIAWSLDELMRKSNWRYDSGKKCMTMETFPRDGFKGMHALFERPVLINGAGPDSYMLQISNERVCFESLHRNGMKIGLNDLSPPTALRQVLEALEAHHACGRTAAPASEPGAQKKDPDAFALPPKKERPSREEILEKQEAAREARAAARAEREEEIKRARAANKAAREASTGGPKAPEQESSAPLPASGSTKAERLAAKEAAKERLRQEEIANLRKEKPADIRHLHPILQALEASDAALATQLLTAVRALASSLDTRSKDGIKKLHAAEPLSPEELGRLQEKTAMHRQLAELLLSTETVAKAAKGLVSPIGKGERREPITPSRNTARDRAFLASPHVTAFLQAIGEPNIGLLVDAAARSNDIAPGRPG